MSQWEPPEIAWQHELLARMPPSIDMSQIAESLRLTPTERVERARLLAEFLEEVARAGGSGLPQAD